MTINDIVKKVKWSLGKEKPMKVFIGENFNSSVSFSTSNENKCIVKIDGIPVYIDKNLQGKNVRVEGKKKEIVVDLSAVKKHKLLKVR